MDVFDEMIKREHQRLSFFEKKFRDADLHHVTSVRNAISILDNGINASLSYGTYGIWCYNEVPLMDIITAGFPIVSHRYIIARGLCLPVYVDFVISKRGIEGRLEPDFDIGYLALGAPRYQIKGQENIPPRYLSFCGLYEGNNFLERPDELPGENCMAVADDIPSECLKDFLQDIANKTSETIRDV